ncbi:MAG: Flp family type IVb pilin [Bacteroidota bacterium]|nr:Flp family type IVb pilin [Kiloniellaceae bacterium]
MSNIWNWIESDDSGAAAIEYGLIASLVSVAAITGIGLGGETLALLLDLAVEALQLPD